MALINRFDICNFLNYDFSNDFYLYEVGKQACPPSYSYGPVVRNRYIFHFLLSGKGTLYINDQEYHVCAHQGFIIPPGVMAFYQADQTDPWDYIWVHLDGPKVPDYLQQSGLTLANPVFIPTEDAYILDTIMIDILENSEKKLYCIGKIYELFDYVVTYSSTKLPNTTSRKLQYVKTIINYIQLKYSEPIHIDDIAHACGLDRSYLTKLFKDVTGTTLSDYLLSYRMKAACKLLRETNNSIQYIAYAVGYTDAFTFSKAFKRYENHSPSEYRQGN